MTVSVVICAYTTDRAQALAQAARSAQAQSPAEVIVVVDHCAELEAWARAELDGVRVVPSSGPPGLSGARNTGLAVARGAVVAFLDDDACAGAGWLARLVAPFSDPAVGATGGTILPRWPARRPAWLPEEFDWVVGCSYRGLPERRARVRNVIGANMALRRAAALAAGGFATELGRVGTRPLGCEETDLCIRLGAQGLAVVFVPEAVVHHAIAPERATVRYFLARCHAEGRSKRALTRRAGAAAGLASERRYLMRTLPAAVGASLRRGALRRAAATGAGVAATGTGYLRGGP